MALVVYGVSVTVPSQVTELLDKFKAETPVRAGEVPMKPLVRLKVCCRLCMRACVRDVGSVLCVCTPDHLIL